MSVEMIAYGMPAYKFNKKPFVYFACFENHIGLYATPAVHEHFADQLKGYKKGKGSVQFPHEKPFPEALIQQMVAYKLRVMNGL